MCDYSLRSFKSRPAEVGEKLVTHNFGTGSRGFAPINRDADEVVAVCLLPGTEVSFRAPIELARTSWGVVLAEVDEVFPNVAVFAQKDKERPCVHHDCLQFADGRWVLLTSLAEGQVCTVLQLPAVPRSETEIEAQRRAEFAG